MKLYKCETCGNIFEVIQDSAIVPTCCNNMMKQVKINYDETASKEKHIPIYSKKDHIVDIQVGSLLHPSAPEHHIEWISLVTNKNRYTHHLKNNEPPVTSFHLNEKDETIEGIYAYCNLHGLWYKKGSDKDAEVNN